MEANKKIRVVGIGELLWDVLPDGKKLGGAPCNFVYHAQKQGAIGLALSAVGNDDDGKEILTFLKSKKISSELVQINDKPTSTVNVTLNAKGEPEYSIHKNVAWDFIECKNRTKEAVLDADIVCFGSLAQRNNLSKRTIESLLSHCKSSALIVYDINLRQNFYNRELIENSLQLCNVLKLNEEELPVVRDLLGITAESEEEQLLELIKRYNLKLAALTKGGEGSLLKTDDEISYIDTPKVEVKDTVGAGDSFTAVMIVGFAKGDSLTELTKKRLKFQPLSAHRMELCRNTNKYLLIKK